MGDLATLVPAYLESRGKSGNWKFRENQEISLKVVENSEQLIAYAKSKNISVLLLYFGS